MVDGLSDRDPEWGKPHEHPGVTMAYNPIPYLRRIPAARVAGAAVIFLVVLSCIILSAAEPRTRNALSRTKGGWDNLSRGNVERAIVQFRHALRENPRYVSALNGLGRCYLETGEYGESQDLFNRALKLDEASIEAMMGLGMVYTRMGRYTDAIEFFERVLKVSEDSHDARYGIARAYYAMGKAVWAKRKIDTILQMNPYHLDTILLKAEIKAGEGRLSEARSLVEKAITVKGDSPEPFVRAAEIMYRDYYITENGDSLTDARDYLARALALEPGHYRANYLAGYMSLAGGQAGEALEYFGRCGDISGDIRILYASALCQDRLDRGDAALATLLKGVDAFPSDSMLRARTGELLVARDYSPVHPARVMLSRMEMDQAGIRMKKNLSEEAMLYLRKTILMNPMDKKPREMLMDYYDALGYHLFIIDELKELDRMFPGSAYQTRLSSEIMKRRNELTGREGFGGEDIPRDVPRVLVMDFTSRGDVSLHPDGGSVLAGQLSFALEQYGRMNPVGFRTRSRLAAGIRADGDHLSDAMEYLEGKIRKGEMKPVDYIITGEYHEGGDFLSLTARLIDLRRNIIIGEFTLTSYGRESLSQIAIRSARRIYGMIPFRGRILKVTEEGIIVNLGLYDGIVPGDLLAVPHYDSSTPDRDDMNTRLYFTVKECDTVLCLATPPNSSLLNDLDSRDRAYPMKRRRARLIE